MERAGRPRTVGCVADPILHLSLPVADLPEARHFYEEVLGLRIGRVRPEWIDVWFFGMQLTLQHRPDEIASAPDQGVRHFGVTLPTAQDYDALVERLRGHGVVWLAEPAASTAAELSGKTSAKLADPSGNVIELKHYPSTTALDE
jgi:extradiol dioxygenase family protein